MIIVYFCLLLLMFSIGTKNDRETLVIKATFL